MLKSKSQSMQAPLALQARTYYSFPNTKQTYLQNNTARTGVQTSLFKQNKQTNQSKRKLRRSKNNTTVHETIKTKCLDRPELFIDEEGDALGIPKLWRLYFLDISWGHTMVASPSLSFCPFFISLHHSLSTPEIFPSYKTSHNLY